jgi:hypothetical protein
LVLDLLTGVVIAIAGGGFLGALSALLGWASSGEAFEGKKMAIGVATGVIAGIGIISLSFSAIKASIIQDPTGLALLELMIPIGLSIVGTDMVRAKVSAMIANRGATPAAVETNALKAEK